MIMRIFQTFIAALIACLFLVTAADARPKQTGIITCDSRGCRPEIRSKVRDTFVATGQGIIGRRPKGCPHRFCGCEASLYVYGKIKPELNLASNWIRKFPRTAPAPGMAAARSGHVMVLMRRVHGSDWLVHDGNSGGGYTREHVRSIKGYVIVDPHGGKVAGL